MARRTLLSGLLLVALLALSGAAMAANLQDPSGSFTGLLDLVKNSASAWDARLTGYAQKLFWGLAVISFVWTFFPLVFKQADFGEIVGELIRFILVIGFFYALLLNATEWADAIVESFRQAGAAAAGTGTTGMRPGDVFALAVDLADTIGKAKTWNPLEGAAIAIAGVVVLLCFAFIAAFMGVTLVESYVVINASVLFMGFGGSPWTREYAIALARYAVSVGAKLFVLTLIIGLIATSAKSWQAAYQHNTASMWTMVGLSLVCAYLARTIPDLIQGLITGTSMNGGVGIGTMTAVAAAGATAGAAAAASFMENVTKANNSGGAGGGLAASIADSLSGGNTGPSGVGGGGGNGPTGGGSGGGDAIANSLSPRIGGGSGGPSSSSSAAIGSSQTGGSSSASSSGVQQAAKQAEKRKDQDSEQSSSVSGRSLASGALRTAGVISALAVPGMEGAAGLSLGPQPPSSPTKSEQNDDDMSVNPVEPENVIRPADAPHTPSPTQEPSSAQKAQKPNENTKGEGNS